MKFLRTCFAIGFAAMLTACAGGSGSPVEKSPELPLQTPLHASQAPIVNLDGTLHIGADVAPSADRLPIVVRHDNTRVFHGSIRDGVGASEVIDYLRADAASFAIQNGDDGTDIPLFPDGLVFRFAATPPTVRIAEGTSPELLDETVRVVQAINAALPRDWQLRFSPEPPPAEEPGPLDGEILVTFAPQEDWPAEAMPPTGEGIGLAEPRYNFLPTGDPAGAVENRNRWGPRLGGRLTNHWARAAGRHRARTHTPARACTRGPGTFRGNPHGGGGGSDDLSAHILHPLDREALYAVYGRLQSGTLPDRIAEELGPWSDTSTHVRGAIDNTGGEIAFGAALRNGLSQPWAAGPTPNSTLEDNMELSGSVRWSGRLLGLTPRAETVAGTADLNVELATLSGRLDFSELEHWTADAAPGATGSGATWRDGHLTYGIEVRGNSFIQTGGAGQVTGAFFGPSHEGMGGVLVREDMSAGFGGNR